MVQTQIKPTNNAMIHAPFGTYWVFTKEGAAVHGAQTGAIINRHNPYEAPTEWINDKHVVPEELE